MLELPELARGKGNKIIQIPNAKASQREEFCIGLMLLNENSQLILHADKRSLKLTSKDLANFHGERGQRGALLPKGLRKVDRWDIV